jgi:hypothetical protein
VNDHELINAKKDTTRPSNVYYGLNWGFRSDNTVKIMKLNKYIDRKIFGHRRSSVFQL